MEKIEKPPTAPKKSPAGDRVAKVIARAGLCSRRDAERLVEEGRVKLNGKILKSPAQNVTARDLVLVDNKPLPDREPVRLWLYHKPAGLVVSHRDPEGRPTVFEKLQDLPRVMSVGRLDINTEGLLLLTNSGALERALELPSTGWTRRYRVRAYGHISQATLDKLKDGAEVDGVQYGPIEAKVERSQGDNTWLSMALKEGKNREVKKLCEHVNITVNRLIRVSYGPFILGEMPRGMVEEVPRRVIAAQLGPKFKDIK
jgi:23S rRNA pseudouridine2605 synthase